MEKLYNWFSQSVYSLPAINDFERGFYAALILTVLVFLLLFIIGLIIKLMLRKPAVPGVTLEREDGDIFISRNAIFTAVCRLEEDFPELEILKVAMIRDRHRNLGLTVTVMFDEKDMAFDAVAGSFKQRVFSMLNNSFGIESVKTVAIVLSKIPAVSDKTDGGDTVAVATNVLGSGF